MEVRGSLTKVFLCHQSDANWTTTSPIRADTMVAFHHCKKTAQIPATQKPKTLLIKTDFVFS